MLQRREAMTDQARKLGVFTVKKGPLTAALEKSDLTAAAAALRHDVVFHSPILATVADEVRGDAVVVKALGTSLAYIGPPRNVEEFRNPDGRYIVTFDGVIDGNLIQIAMLVTEDAANKVGAFVDSRARGRSSSSSGSTWSA